jgi:hypothetical protein
MTAGGRSQTVTDTQIASPMPGDIHSMKHWKLSKMRTPERSPVIFQAKPCALTGRKRRRARSIEAQSIRDFLNARKASTWLAEPGGMIPMVQLKHDIAQKARQNGGNAVIFVSSASQLAGYYAASSASAAAITSLNL